VRRVDPKGECAFLVLLVGNGSSGMQWHDTEEDAREAAEQLESSCERGETVYLLRALSMSEEEL
jgi:hypothetical protein